MDLTTFAHTLSALKATSSIKTKKEILATCGCLDLFKVTYDPQVQYHVTGQNAAKFYSRNPWIADARDFIKTLAMNLSMGITGAPYPESVPQPYLDHCRDMVSLGMVDHRGCLGIETLFAKLSAREITGNLALFHTALFLDSLGAPQRSAMIAILDRNLRVGVSRALLNKVSPGLIPTFTVALGVKYTPGDIKGDNYLVSIKYDGVRAIIHVKEGDHEPVIYTRTGHVLGHLDSLRGLRTNVPGGLLLDGEILHPGGLQALMSALREPEFIPEYKVFDILTPGEFWGTLRGDVFSERLARYSSITIPAGANVSMITQHALGYADELYAQVVANSGEGIMYRRDTYYSGKRSKDILKRKMRHRDEYRVAQIITGEIAGETMLSAIVLDNGCKVGSGFSMEQRRQFHAHPEDIIGMVITVEYMAKTAAGSLREPIFITLHGACRDT